jgi:hypothetical protein
MSSVTEYVVVNGARIERRFFEENLEEARSLEWFAEPVSSIVGHTHCLICMKPLPDGRGEEIFRSRDRWLCSFCHSAFIEEQVPKESELL